MRHSVSEESQDKNRVVVENDNNPSDVYMPNANYQEQNFDLEWQQVSNVGNTFITSDSLKPFEGNLPDHPMTMANPREQPLMCQVDSGIATGTTSPQTISLNGNDEEFDFNQVRFEEECGQLNLSELDQLLDELEPSNDVAAATALPDCEKQRTDDEENELMVREQIPQISRDCDYVNEFMGPQSVHQMIYLLQLGEENGILEAARTIYQLSENEVCLQKIANTFELVLELVRSVLITNNPETIRCIARSLMNLSKNPLGRVTIVNSGSIKVLLHWLSSSLERVAFFAIVTLHNLVLYGTENSKTAIRIAGGIPKLIDLLKYDNVSLLLIVIDCLKLVAIGHTESQQTILVHNCTTELVRILWTQNCERLLHTTMHLLEVLSSCQKYEYILLEAGVMQALAPLLNHRSKILVEMCLSVLRNISNCSKIQGGLDVLLQRLMDLLKLKNFAIVGKALETLANLTRDNKYNKTFVLYCGGIQTVMGIIKLDVGRGIATERALVLLLHLISDETESNAVHSAVLLNEGFPIILNLLGHNPWSRITFVIQLIGKLGHFAANRSLLVNYGVVNRLTCLCNNIYLHPRFPFLENDRIDVDGICLNKLLSTMESILHFLK